MEQKAVWVPMALAVGAAVFYLLVLTSKERALSESYETGQVLVARVDIPERTVIKEEMVEPVRMPRKYMDQDAFEVRTPADIKLIANLVSRIRIPKGNQIPQSALISLSPEAGLGVKIPPGYRGAILGIEPELRALIKPGDRVDVLVTFDALLTDNRREKVTMTILQNLLVLAVGSNLGQGLDAKGAKSLADKEERTAAFAEKAMIAVALNPEELQYLELAKEQGKTSVGLRGLGDHLLHPIKVAMFRELLKN
ncbi:MAG: Flp pilus assembly protein CpaB [Elusimicrobia bacterium]|nr:Flp pilus assembly protein CpaB [Elusimicrobiota bacterium]